VPRTQITSAKIMPNGDLNVGGPLAFADDEVLFNVEVVIVQGASYAYGQTSPRGAARRPGWSCPAHGAGAFDVTKPAVGFGTMVFLIVADPAKGLPDALPQTLSWAEAVQLS
jgi:hypothetical protein